MYRSRKTEGVKICRHVDRPSSRANGFRCFHCIRFYRSISPPRNSETRRHSASASVNTTNLLPCPLVPRFRNSEQERRPVSLILFRSRLALCFARCLLLDREQRSYDSRISLMRNRRIRLRCPLLRLVSSPCIEGPESSFNLPDKF